MPQRREAALLGSALAPRSGTLRAQVPCLAQLGACPARPWPRAVARLHGQLTRLPRSNRVCCRCERVPARR
jgi:hypothetical protein